MHLCLCLPSSPNPSSRPLPSNHLFSYIFFFYQCCLHYLTLPFSVYRSSLSIGLCLSLDYPYILYLSLSILVSLYFFLSLSLFPTILPYSDKRKQLFKMKCLVIEQNVSVIMVTCMYIDIDAISLYLDLNIFQHKKMMGVSAQNSE